MTNNVLEHRVSDEDVRQNETPRVGRFFTDLRLAKGLSIEDIVAETKVSRTNLQAIENEEYEKLPPDVFTRGLIALYGNALGQDGRQLAKQFLRERDDRLQKNKISTKNKHLRSHHGPEKMAEPVYTSSALVAGTMLLLIVLSFIVFYWHFSWHPFSFFLSSGSKDAAQSEAIFHPADPSTRQMNPQDSLDIEAMSFAHPKFVLHLQKWSQAEHEWKQWHPDKKSRTDTFLFPQIPPTAQSPYISPSSTPHSPETDNNVTP